MEGHPQPLEPRKQGILLRVSAALPDLDNGALIDALEALDWDGDGVITIMGGVPIPTIFSEGDWPSLDGAMALHNTEDVRRNSLQRSQSVGRGMHGHSEPTRSSSVPTMPPNQTPPVTSAHPVPPAPTSSSTSVGFRKFAPTIFHKILEAELMNYANRGVLEAIHANTTRNLVLMRGVPGAGKSSLAEVVLAVAGTGVSVSADQFFLDHKGNYKFNPSMLPSAHQAAQANCQKGMEERISPIVIDNTNTEAWEMIPYVAMALQHDYSIHILEPSTPWKWDAGKLATKNTHGVPQKKIKEMIKRFDKNITVDQLILMSKNMRPANAASTKSFHHRGNASSSAPLARPLKAQDFLRKEVPTQEISAPAQESSLNASSLNFQKLTINVDPSPSGYTIDTSRVTPEEEIGIDGEVEKMVVSDIRKLLTDSSSASVDSSPLPSPPEQLDQESSTTPSDAEWAWEPAQDWTFDPGNHDQQIMRDEANLLQCLFPSAETLYLDDLFQCSQGNLTWCVEVLVNGGYEQDVDLRTNRSTTLKFTSSSIISLDGKEVQNGILLRTSRQAATEEATSDASVKRRRKRSHSDQGQTPGLLATIGTRSSPRPTSSFATSSPNVEYELRRSSWDSISRPLQGSSLHAQQQRQQNLPDLLEPIDGEDWIEMKVDEGFIQRIKKLYAPPPFGGEEFERTGDMTLRIPPTLAFELGKLVILNEAYKEYNGMVGSNEKAEGASGLQQPDRMLSFQLTVRKLKTEFPKLPEAVIWDAHSAYGGRYQQTQSYLRSQYYPPIFHTTAEDEALLRSQQKTPVTRRKSTTGFEANVGVWEGGQAGEELEGAVGGVDTQDERTFEELRQEALYHHQKRAEFQQKINEVSRCHGGKAIAEYYRAERDKHRMWMQEANYRAQEKVSTQAHQRVALGDTVLDLHYLYVKEAIAALTSFLNWHERLRSSGLRTLVVKIITGKGKNSEGKVPRIKPAVIDYLRKGEYRHADFDGLIMVTLDQ